MSIHDARDELAPIACDRFTLELFTLPSIEALLDGQIDEAARMLNVRFPHEDWLPKAGSSLRFRRADLLRDPGAAPWLLRAIVLPDRKTAGHISFHGPPEDGVAELGYTVFASHRRRGYATEAARGLMTWARSEHGVRAFRLSIAPDNAPSLALAAKLGFARTGEQIDEIDGLEYVFELRIT